MENYKLREELFWLKNQPRSTTHIGIPPDKIRSLVQLCHPDKHNGSTLANEITHWLLKLKKESK